jgi:hypothetical protein
MDVVVETLARFGLPGAICGVLVWLYWQKDQELKRERDARIADAKAFNELALSLQAKALDTVSKLKELFDELRRSGSMRRTP